MTVEPRLRRVQLYDKDGKVTDADSPVPVDIKDDHGNSTGYDSPEQTRVLQDILKELKIMNFHLAVLTDNTIKKTEVD